METVGGDPTLGWRGELGGCPVYEISPGEVAGHHSDGVSLGEAHLVLSYRSVVDQYAGHGSRCEQPARPQL